VISRKINSEIALKVNGLLRKSIEFAMADKSASHEFVLSHAREMDNDVVNAHISLYVNEFSLSLGETGRTSLKRLFRAGHEKKILPPVPDDLFLSE
jgi:1,4-dihydroxy-6-naphthoate synthase